MSTQSPSQRPATERPRGRRIRTAAALAAVAALAGVASAGDLEPPGPPAPTMKTLDQIPPIWGRVLPADDGDAQGCNSSRFECVNNRTWVIDRQTGLVWHRSVPIFGSGLDWAAARRCLFSHDGAWRLPSMTELASLRADPSSSDPRGLPSGHPFLIPGTGPLEFWSMTTSASDPSQAWFYRMSASQGSAVFPQEGPKTALKQRWCVRASHPGLSVY